MASNAIEALEICLEAEGMEAQAKSAIKAMAKIEDQSQKLLTLANLHQGSINEAEAMIASLSTPREE